jgi:hypothetical protein
VSFIENIFKSAPFVVEEPPLPPGLDDFVAWAIKYKLSLPPDTPAVVLDVARRKLTAMHSEWMLRAAMVNALSEPAPKKRKKNDMKVDLAKVKPDPNRPYVLWIRGEKGVRRFACGSDAAKVCERAAQQFFCDALDRLLAPRPGRKRK